MKRDNLFMEEMKHIAYKTETAENNMIVVMFIYSVAQYVCKNNSLLISSSTSLVRLVITTMITLSF